MSETFDLVVIGSGPAGLRAAIQGAKLGRRVAVVERGRPGGGSVHTGTIPSKSLREAALRADRPHFGEAMAHMRQVVETEAAVVAEQLSRNGVRFFAGSARFEDAQTIRVGDRQTLRASAVIVAVGTRPVRHPEFFGGAGALDSDDILKLEKKPRSLLVLGAGVIGCEYASIFARLGVEVTLADRRQELLRGVDAGVLDPLRTAFTAAGIDVLLGAKLEGAKRSATGSLKISLNGRARSFSHALICLGRQANTGELNLSGIGVATDPRGYITVDRSTYQTSVPSIYAVGDVIGAPGLAAAAAEQGRLAASHLFGQACSKFPETFPYGIYTIPEISWAGLTEGELREQNVSYVAGKAPFAEVARGIIAGQRTGFIKLLVQRESRQLVGVHVLGHGATELVHIGQVAMALGAPVDFFLENVFNYPTYAEAYKVAALHAINQLRQNS